MSKHKLKVLEFPASTSQKPVLVNNKVSGTALLSIVDTKNAGSALINFNYLDKQAFNAQRPMSRRSEYLTGISVTLAAHLFWLFSMPAAETQESVKPPEPIMVQWLSKPQSHAEPAKPLQPQQQNKPAKPIIKPRPKPAKVATKQAKPLRAATHKATEPISAPTGETPSKPPVAAAFQASSTAAAVTKPRAVEPAPVTLPHLNADYLDNPAPQYPSVSRELGEQGRVLVRAMVTADGRVGQVVLRKSSGFSYLDQAALEGVKHWRFVPARQGERHVSAWVLVPVVFSLEG